MGIIGTGLAYARDAIIPILILCLFLYCLPPLLLSGYFTYHAMGLAKANTSRRRRLLQDELGLGEEEGSQKIIAGFFHPYCNAGGGGERVLYTAIAHLQRTDPSIVSVVYTGDTDATKDEIISKVKARFGIDLDPRSLVFVWLNRRWMVESKTWRMFTLLGQSVGSVGLLMEAMSQLVPDIYLDTMGYGFTYPALRSLTPAYSTLPRNAPGWRTPIPIIAYIHYPTISSSMLKRVSAREAGVTNSGMVARSSVLSLGKLLYYHFFTSLYTDSLSTSRTILLTNSSWTKNHIDALLTLPSSPVPRLLSALGAVFGRRTDNRRDEEPPQYLTVIGGGQAGTPEQGIPTTEIIYPPCDTSSLSGFKLEGREKIILSVAQFRPEKDHPTQLRALAALFASYPQHKTDGVKLVLLGSCRNDEDMQRVNNLKELANELRIEDSIDFVLNAPYTTLLSYLGRSSVGVNTMVEEHFGIGVVEFMAAGLIPVVHASGGPLGDIVVPVDGEPTGYHATTVQSFSQSFHQALSLAPSEDLAMRSRARQQSAKFSEKEFEIGFESIWRGVKRDVEWERRDRE